jgi:hypothetical protein
MSKLQLKDQTRQSEDASHKVGGKLAGPPSDRLLLLADLAKLRKSAINFVMSVCLLAWLPAWNN